MRLSAIILAIVVIMLTCMPCADTFAFPLGTDHIESGNDIPQHEHDEDLCSPFCHCSCCSTHVIEPQQFTTIKLSAAIICKRTTYKGFIPEDEIAVFLPIWQPPKL